MKTKYALITMAVVSLTLAQTNADQHDGTATSGMKMDTQATALANELFPKLDTDHDGLISRSEFTANFHLLPGQGATGTTATTGEALETKTDPMESGNAQTDTGAGASDQD